MKREMNKPILRAAAMLLLAAMLLSAASVSLAWLAQMQNENVSVGGSSIASYFGGGDGKSAATAYLIKTSTHLYNLAWLQNLGKFPTKTYFKLDNNLDMAGELDGNEETSGAIPPIGTASNPFVGEFIGNGKVIENVWVSSDPDDWKEQPTVSVGSVGSQIGFFGATDGGAQISNFVLKNIEVTVAPDESVTSFTAGLVAGFVNSDIDNVGVDNGKLSLGGVQVHSESSLIGERGPDVEWVEAPEGPPIALGSDLLIDPNKSGNVFTAVTAGASSLVPGATNKSAYYVGTLNQGSSTLKGYYYKYTGGGGTNGAIVWSPTSASVVTHASDRASNTNKSPSSTIVNSTMWDTVTALSSATYILPTTAPTSSALQTITDIGKSVPINSIWFKPQNAGSCHIAITKSNNSADVESLSLFSYQRDSGGNIITTSWHEIVLSIAKKATGGGGGNLYGNGYVAFFEVVIPEEAITGGYEFVIGKSSTGAGSVAGFLYLILPGTGAHGHDTPDNPSGGGTYQINKIDYTCVVEGVYPIIAEGASYQSKNILLEIQSATVNEALYYWMPNDENLYYRGTAIHERIDNDEDVTASEQAGLVPPERQTTAP